MSVRSLLFVPANERRLKASMRYEPDAFIFDLEDAIKPEHKEEALKELTSFLKQIRSNKKIYVRINPARYKTELERLKASRIDAIVIPKVESRDDIEIYRDYNTDIIALIETPMGMIHIEQIVSCDLVKAIGFGAEDYCALTDMKKCEHTLSPLKARMVMYAKAYNKRAYDMVEAEFHDLELFKKLARSSYEFGFDGKLAIHPAQIDIINECYRDDAEKLIRLKNAYEEQEEGIIYVDGQLLEGNHYKKVMERIKCTDFSCESD